MRRRGFIAWLSRLGPIIATVALANAVTALLTPAQGADEVLVSIGTGELNGVYYPVAKAICAIVNQDIRVHGVRCSPETTPGSVYNIDALRTGELDLAIVQSDVEYAAYNGQGVWLGHPYVDLRSVMSLYPELVTVMARADTPIHSLADLAGRRVNVGSRDSGTRATWDAIQTELGWHGSDQVHPAELRTAATVSALCSGAIDASMMIVGHPSAAVAAQEAACATDFVAVAGSAIDKLLKDRPYYQRGTIGSAYGLATEIPTFGVRAALVTSASVDTHVIAVITKELLTHLSELRALVPTLAGLASDKTNNQEGMTAPLHPGARLAYTDLERVSE
jgi:TRAP transporter TAXI family solute receptor